MIWKVRKRSAKFRAKHQWHNWFAWYPVRIPTKGRMSGMHKVWLTTVHRRGTYEGWVDDSYWFWRYAFPGEEYWEKKLSTPPIGPSGVPDLPGPLSVRNY